MTEERVSQLDRQAQDSVIDFDATVGGSREVLHGLEVLRPGREHERVQVVETSFAECGREVVAGERVIKIVMENPDEGPRPRQRDIRSVIYLVAFGGRGAARLPVELLADDGRHRHVLA
ncbi:MAG: hypothetical protein ABI665_16575 [Vicinamibacterales bacterium]